MILMQNTTMQSLKRLLIQRCQKNLNAPKVLKEQASKEDAEAIFRAVDGFGLSRVDFFLEESGRVVFNEINTLPGFTSISMYPMLWKACGLDIPELLDTLIDQAMTRYR